MKLISTLMFLLTLALVAPAQAERIEWTETEQRRTKTIYSESGDIVYQAHWDKDTGALTGAPFDIRARHRDPAPPAKPQEFDSPLPPLASTVPSITTLSATIRTRPPPRPPTKPLPPFVPPPDPTVVASSR